MSKLKILDIKKDTYTLFNLKNKQMFNFVLFFYGLKTKPKTGDFLAFHNELLNTDYEEYSTSYQFGPIGEFYGRNITSIKDVDCIILFSDNKKTYLKRFFG